jgi:hypothetical protein
VDESLRQTGRPVQGRGALPLVLVVVPIGGNSGNEIFRPSGAEPHIAGMGSVGGGQLDATRVLTTVRDPEDVDPCTVDPDCPIDIRAVSKTSLHDRDGQEDDRLQRQRVRAVRRTRLRGELQASPRHEGWPPFGHSDFMALTELFADIRWACGREFQAGSVSRRYHVKERRDRLTCFVPRQALHPTKRIRFTALSRVNQDVIDRAPDHG